MKSVNALIKGHDPDADIYGDCDRACLASLLELTCFEVPHFFNYDGAHIDPARGNQEKIAWLRNLGLTWVELPIEGSAGLDAVLEVMAQNAGGACHTLLGKSKKGIGHCVICQGGAVVHDPTYGQPHGIVGPIDDYFWIGFLVRL